MAESYNAGRQSAFNDPDVSDYIEAYQVSAVLDNNTTDLCARMDGRVLTKEELESFGHPPWHYQCRTIITPIIRGEDYSIDGIPPGTKQQFGPGGRKPRIIKKMPKLEKPTMKPRTKPIIPKGMTSEEWVTSLDKSERRILDYWRGSGYEKIKQAQITGKYPSELKKYIKDMEKALKRAPKYDGTTYRGLHDLSSSSYKKLLNTEIFEWKSFTSGSISKQEALEFAGRGARNKKSILFKIQSKSGVDMQTLYGKEEAEVIMSKGNKYKIVNITENVAGKYGGGDFQYTLIDLAEVAL